MLHFQVRVHRVQNPLALLVSEDNRYVHLDCEFVSNASNEINFTEEEANLLYKNYTRSQYTKGEIVTLTATKNNTLHTVACYAERN